MTKRSHKDVLLPIVMDSSSDDDNVVSQSAKGNVSTDAPEIADKAESPGPQTVEVSADTPALAADKAESPGPQQVDALDTCLMELWSAPLDPFYEFSHAVASAPASAAASSLAQSIPSPCLEELTTWDFEAEYEAQRAACDSDPKIDWTFFVLGSGEETLARAAEDIAGGSHFVYSMVCPIGFLRFGEATRNPCLNLPQPRRRFDEGTLATNMPMHKLRHTMLHN
jgi:hypothetical protein